MIYIKSFTFPDRERETSFFYGKFSNYNNSFYPFWILSENKFERADFEPITVFYGGNGSGKTTALNVIAEKLGLLRDTDFNKSSFFQDYVDMCQAEIENDIPKESRVISSDDVFDYMLNIRSLNEGIDKKREILVDEYPALKYKQLQMNTLEDYDELKRVVKARRSTKSRFIRSELLNNVREFSNGESAYKYFSEKILDNTLYILDEPENSLSPVNQIELGKIIEESARFYGCQFIISTHSPFILSIKGAKIYDLEQKAVGVKKWTELESIRLYYDFFQKHSNEFNHISEP